MKDFLGYELMALMGLPTPRACFVDIWVNDTHPGSTRRWRPSTSTYLVENFHDGYNNLYKPEVRAGALDWTEADAAAEVSDGGAFSTTTDHGFVQRRWRRSDVDHRSAWEKKPVGYPG